MLLYRDENGAFVTPCRECIFAEFKDNPDKELGAIQTGCKFGRIEKFKNRGTQVEWTEDEYVSYNKIHVFCNCIRDREWQSKEGIEVNDIDGAMKKVVFDNTIRWSGVVLCDELSPLDDIEKSIDWMVSQKIKPKNIVISLRSKDTVRHIQEIREKYQESNIPMYFSRCLETSYEREQLDQCVHHVKGQYYVAVQAGLTFSNVIDKLEDAVRDCKLVAIVKEQGLLICQLGIHQAVAGNKIDNIETKVIAIDENNKNSIYTIQQL